MASSLPLDVCILWHMHQPLYEDPGSGLPAMPWVRLHALKDYYDMVALVRERPGVQVTFNLVPILIEQIDKAAGGSAPDRWLEVARKAPEDLSDTDKIFMLDGFFAIHHERTFPVLPRLGELHRKARSGAPLTGWTQAEWRDLQVTFHLAWCGSTLRRAPLVRRLFVKGRSFTELEKVALLELQDEMLKDVIPAYRAAMESGQVELSTTPYFHPILPLLCDVASAREAVPDVPLPRGAAKAPEDARDHLSRGIAYFTERFGQAPAGIWPSEGSLSEQTLDLLEEAGVAWTATDEDILHASLGPSASGGSGGRQASLLQPWQSGERKVSIFFRDRILSDLIGFTYASWNPTAAANDFVERLERIAHGRTEGTRGMIAVILDGENAWEAYPDNGAGFLESLYRALESSPRLRAVTLSRHLAESPQRGSLQRLRAGSWIRGDLLTWIGHPEKNHAWELLGQARAVWLEAGRPPSAERWLRAAQGSDWFWWYGDDHSSAFDSTFDLIFRSLLKRVYGACDREAPEELARPIKRHPGRRRVKEPTGPVVPIVDGRVTDYFEWLAAGSVPAEPASPALHATGGIRSLHYGASEAGLALRVDPDQIPFMETVAAESLHVSVSFPQAARVEAPLRRKPGAAAAPPGVEIVCGRVLEALIPLGALGLKIGSPVEFTVSLLDGQGRPLATFPAEGALTLTVPTPGAREEDWSA